MRTKLEDFIRMLDETLLEKEIKNKADEHIAIKKFYYKLIANEHKILQDETK